ncbi:ABC transporter permease [Nocardioides jejuensis]|uniref:Oligopeptide transport system permease protein OppC n=1 Tax=Nocardioides jejuensis TaxID=2502782 RepID=A0A4R1BWX5_9ACTN|nr:ABC transporter permease [Nocardioides jejuensis]TCJ22278.1 ABC transporter permease [Nocardioides jejuensis]
MTNDLHPVDRPADHLENAIELKEVMGLSQGQIVRRRFLHHRGAIVGLIVLALVILLAYSSVGFSFLGLDVPGWWRWTITDLPDIVNSGDPSTVGGVIPWGIHPFGQDDVGHDVFAMVMKGTQTSIMVMIVVGVVAMVIGIVVGAISGYYRGWTDQALMRITDLFLTFPVIVVGAVLGKRFNEAPPWILAVVLGAILWMTLARLVRGEFLALREREFVDAARVSGARPARIIFKHILPNAMGVIIVQTTLLMSSAVLLETALSFLGFGINPPNVSLGWLVSNYQSAFSARPWLFWWPGLIIIILALCINFIGDGLRDAFDPRQKKVPSAKAMAKADSNAAAQTTPMFQRIVGFGRSKRGSSK